MAKQLLKLSRQLKDYWPDTNAFDRILATQGELFRDVPGRRTLRFVLGNSHFFIKIHTGVGWREIFKNLSQGKLPVLGAANECRAIRKLEALCVDTMTIAGFGQRGVNPARQQSFIITEELINTISLEDLCGEWPKRPPAIGFKRALLEKVADIARTLHENGVNHRDFYICHFLFDQAQYRQGRLILYVIDLHRAQIRAKTPERWLMKDLAALYFSAMDIGLTRRDLFRFLRVYRRAELRDILAAERGFWLKVQAKAEQLYRSYDP